jgi:hypothetical protein
MCLNKLILLIIKEKIVIIMLMEWKYKDRLRIVLHKKI